MQNTHTHIYIYIYIYIRTLLLSLVLIPFLYRHFLFSLAMIVKLIRGDAACEIIFKQGYNKSSKTTD